MLMLAEDKFMLKANVVNMPVMCKPGLHNPYLRV